MEHAINIAVLAVILGLAFGLGRWATASARMAELEARHLLELMREDRARRQT